MIGTFGMLANEVPYGGAMGFGVDRVLDLGFDAQYQFIHGKHAFEAKVSDINEYAQYNASFGLRSVSNPTDTLNSFRATLDYVYDNTYSVTAGYFDVRGSSDALYGMNGATGTTVSARTAMASFSTSPICPSATAVPDPSPGPMRASASLTRNI